MNKGIKGEFKMIKPFKLGCLNFKTKNIEAMKDYYTSVMGLTIVEEQDGTIYLSTGLDHHNIILTPAKESDLASIGYQVSNESLEEIIEKLDALRIDAQIKTDAQPGISKMIEVKDPSGNVIQLYNAIEMTAPGYKENGIVPIKLGHLALGSHKPKETIAFYKDIFNFTYTDTIGERATFLTCNNDHHVLNVSNTGMSYLHHIAFELKDASHQVVSSDILAKNDIPIVWGPTRHTAGHNIATYHHDPDLNLVELFIDMDVLIPELGYFSPRPWHEELPLKPKLWNDNAAWSTNYETTLLDSSKKRFYL